VPSGLISFCALGMMTCLEMETQPSSDRYGRSAAATLQDRRRQREQQLQERRQEKEQHATASASPRAADRRHGVAYAAADLVGVLRAAEAGEGGISIQASRAA